MGLLLSVFSLSGAIAGLVLGYLNDTGVSLKRLVFSGILFKIVGNILYFVGINIYVVVLSRFIAGIGMGLVVGIEPLSHLPLIPFPLATAVSRDISTIHAADTNATPGEGPRLPASRSVPRSLLYHRAETARLPSLRHRGDHAQLTRSTHGYSMDPSGRFNLLLLLRFARHRGKLHDESNEAPLAFSIARPQVIHRFTTRLFIRSGLSARVCHVQEACDHRE